MEREETPTIDRAPEKIEFKVTGMSKSQTHFWGDDGYKYMVEMAIRGEPSVSDQLEKEGWRVVEATIHTVSHVVPGEKYLRKYPGPVQVVLWRRPIMPKHHMRCRVCGQLFDMRELDQMVAHEHDGPREATGIIGKVVGGVPGDPDCDHDFEVEIGPQAVVKICSKCGREEVEAR